MATEPLYYYIKCEDNWLVMEAQELNSPVLMKYENGGANQKWHDDLETGTIRNRNGDYCLDSDDNQFVVSAYVPGKPTQQWVRTPHGNTIHNQHRRGLVPEIAGDAPGARVITTKEKDGDAPGAGVITAKEKYVNNQLWWFPVTPP